MKFIRKDNNKLIYNEVEKGINELRLKYDGIKIAFIIDEISNNIYKVLVEIHGHKIVSRTEFVTSMKKHKLEIPDYIELINAYILENDYDVEICIACSRKPQLADDVLCYECRKQLENPKI